MRITISLVLLLVLCRTFLAAQAPVQEYEVGSLRFDGNVTLGDDQLLNVMQTRETPWGIWKWIYHRFDKEILGGQKPEYFDPIIFSADYHK